MKILAAKSFIFISFKFACLNKYWHRICGGGGGGVNFGPGIFGGFDICQLYHKYSCYLAIVA